MPPLDRAEFTSLQVERLGQVLRVTLDNPRHPLNTIDEILHRELAELFALLRVETEALAVVLTGNGKAFSAGGDFDWFPQLQDIATLPKLRRDAKQLIWDLVDVEIPVVAALNGPAVGLGATIALLCDIIVASDDAVLADPHVRVGIVAGDGGTAIWPLLVGPALAKEFLLTGDSIPATRAYELGLINHVVPTDELATAALALANRLAAMPSLAIQYTKSSVNKLVKEALNTTFDYAASLELVTLLSHDHQEALSALRERRPGRYSGT